MDLLPTAEQQQIIDTIRGFLAEAAPVQRLRPDKHGQIGNPDAALWPQLAELGFLGLGLSEDHGGIGLSAIEEALVYREFGRALVSLGALGLTLASHLASSSDPAIAAAIVGGSERVGLATPRGPATGGATVSGKFHLLDAEDARYVAVILPDGVALTEKATFDDVTRHMSMDSNTILERGTLSGAAPLAWSSADDELLHARATLLLAAYAVGMAEASLAMAVDYAKVREQFGKVIGSFQAVKHKCADMAIVAEVASCQVAFASIVLAKGGRDAVYQAHASKIVAVDAALKNSAQNIQVHGAIGFTAETDAHIYVKRSHVVDFIAGDLREQRAALIRVPSPPA